MHDDAKRAVPGGWKPPFRARASACPSGGCGFMGCERAEQRVQTATGSVSEGWQAVAGGHLL
ncbi:MAG: hypothetical protein RhofKO_34680 [Rhodothermales bacterium]